MKRNYPSVYLNLNKKESILFVNLDKGFASLVFHKGFSNISTIKIGKNVLQIGLTRCPRISAPPL